MPKVDLDSVEQNNRTGYPQPYAADMTKRWSRRLASATGLTDFGATHVMLEPGGISSQRHWHEAEDELVVMLAGEAVLVEDEGETVLRAGDVAVFLKGVPNGHHLVNRSNAGCVFLAVGKPATSDCHYPDIDLRLDGTASSFTHKDGTPYATGSS